MQLPLHGLTKAKNFIDSLRISIQQVSIQKKNRLARPYNRQEERNAWLSAGPTEVWTVKMQASLLCPWHEAGATPEESLLLAELDFSYHWSLPQRVSWKYSYQAISRTASSLLLSFELSQVLSNEMFIFHRKKEKWPHWFEQKNFSITTNQYQDAKDSTNSRYVPWIDSSPPPP